MCAVFGFYIKNLTLEDFSLIKRVISNSEIRGMHATGVSYVDKENKIKTMKLPIRGSQFVDHMIEHTDFMNPEGHLIMIGHCRYSTSDLNYNQPIASSKYSIAHNGVITQSPSENWEREYGFKFETKNDSEIVLRTLEAGKNSLVEYPDASIACLELSPEKITFYRNGKRPLHYNFLDGDLIISSTSNILKRSGINSSIDSGFYSHNSYDGETLKKEFIENNSKDLQNV